jgi:D-sedoheptulose 7-phosphate isomerase
MKESTASACNVLLTNHLVESIAVHQKIAEENLGALTQATEAVIECLRRGGKVLLFGNGGSAAQAQHIAAELVGRYLKERPALSAIALTTDTSNLTAIGNDYSFDLVFARQIEALARPGDVVIALSTSGRSPNILRGIEAAKSQGTMTIGLTGGEGRPLRDQVDIAIVVPSYHTPHIQEAHIAMLHALCGAVEVAIFGAGRAA